MTDTVIEADAEQVTEAEALPPVQISGQAFAAYANALRKWSGWPKASLVFGQPDGSPLASCNHIDKRFTVNADVLVRNPARRLDMVTPYRMRQEAFLTGAMLHEAGHARFSHWQPSRYGNPDVLKHSDGTDVKPSTLALARLMEEPRIEGLIYNDAAKYGAAGLEWTMRAVAAEWLPMTRVSTDPDQQVMDVLSSWALRAGRQIAIENDKVRWVTEFTTFLHNTISAHLTAQDDQNPYGTANDVIIALTAMILCEDNTGPSMVDHARFVLSTLFPETDEDDMPQPQDSVCSTGGGASMGDEQAQEQGEDGTSGDESDEQGAGSAAGDGEGEGEGEPGGGEAAALAQALAERLAEMEEVAKSSDEDEATEQEGAQPSPMGGQGPGGQGGGSTSGTGWREPTKEEREVNKRAERFLRDLIAPTETMRRSITSSPSALVDGAAYAAWKHSGMVREPKFFVQQRREVVPHPPVKVAILVDVSGSMDELQKPSALLSWALAAAAFDLRNFAGRGRQIESTLIHWGDEAHVVQRNGEMMPGLREFRCWFGTEAMDSALLLAEEQIPGFLDLPDDGKPENRLLIQFTDWQLNGWARDRCAKQVHRALAAGVNMLTVAPGDYRPHTSDYSGILSSAPVTRGRSHLFVYNKNKPEQVWDEASRMMKG